ncbi:MAG: alpha-hydroxy-acid oxidizing protein [Lachnospiraceae bacterium]|nr:alpha-hydroxy-acid oxidizing protein [Lachnospiraceae bacterium]
MERMYISDEITRTYFDRLLVEFRHIDSVWPDTSLKLWGREFKTPVMTAALSHLHNTRPEGMKLMAEGAYKADAICFSGMGPVSELGEMLSTNAAVIKIIKPYKDRGMITERIKFAEEHGAFAVGMDIDHAFSRKGYDEIEGDEMRPVTEAELKSIISSTKLPFVIKGVLSVSDAQKAVNAGASAIVISHHNGRLDTAVPPLMIIEDIKKVVGNMPIFVDCSVQSGLDVYKCLALGATAVCVGRPLMPRLKENGSDGVKDIINEITNDLKYTMSMTGASNLASIDPSTIHKATFL